MRRRKGNERGSALVLSIFILFAMLAMGMLAMRSATQNISGSGNLRLNKQARYVAEAGLYHAITLLNRDGPNILSSRSGPGADKSRFVVESARGPATTSVVSLLSENGARLVQIERPAPQVFSVGPAALGLAGTASGLLPSYRVEVSGFQPWACPPGFDEMALQEQGEGCCLMHFESHGMIADKELPNEEDLTSFGAADRFAEHRLKAGVVLGPFSLQGCVQ